MEPNEEKGQQGKRAADKNPEQSKIARSNAAKAAWKAREEERAKREGGKSEPTVTRIDRNRDRVAGSGGAAGRSNNPPGPSPAGNKPPAGKFLGDDPQKQSTETPDPKRAADYKVNFLAVQEALPYYLKSYAQFLNQIAEWITDRPGSKVIISVPALPDAEAKADAELLKKLVEQKMQWFVERYWGFVGFFLFVKHTFGRAKVKKVENLRHTSHEVPVQPAPQPAAQTVNVPTTPSDKTKKPGEAA